MASACVNNIGISPENFLDCPPATFSSYGWLSPRISFSREYTDEISKEKNLNLDLESPVTNDAGDFEFRLEDPVIMLPADELFSDGKLVPLHISSLMPELSNQTPAPAPEEEVRSPESMRSRRRNDVVSSLTTNDPYLFSPKAPRCSSRWREILGLKKLHLNNREHENGIKTASSKSIRLFLHRNSKTTSSPSSDLSMNSPLLMKDSESESISMTSSSRHSLSSSSSSSHDHDDLPRHSLDSEKPKNQPHIRSPGPRARIVRPRMVAAVENLNPRPLIDHPAAAATTTRVGRAHGGEVTADSPRMNSSGKVVFQSLERSSSSPSSFNGGPRYKHRGMERSYSANVRVINVSVFGFGQLFSSQSQKKEGNNGGIRTSSRINKKESSS